jgi:hypothetical protein
VPNVAGTQGIARASAEAALCGTASIAMSLLQQIPEKYHDHDDVHIELANAQSAPMHSQEIMLIQSKLEVLGMSARSSDRSLA